MICSGIATVPEPGLWTVTLGFAVIIVSICYRRIVSGERAPPAEN
jgi:hypothetical protein